MNEVTTPRRQMRRPVAGAIPDSLPLIEDQPDMPTWFWTMVGFTFGAFAVALAGMSVVMYWWHRLWSS